MKALDGTRIALTRTPEGCRDWAGAIERRGAVPVSFPCLEHRPLDDQETRRRLREALKGAAWLALTSPRAVAGVADLLAGPLPEEVSVATVGPATASAAARALGRVDLQARDGTATALARALAERLSPAGERAGRPASPIVVWAAAANGLPDFEDTLRTHGHGVLRIPVYRTVILPGLPRRRRIGDDADVVLLASPSAVTGLARRAQVGPDVDVVTIGPTTTAAARAAGFAVDGEAVERSLAGLLEAIP